MLANEIRQLYVDFFTQRGHLRMPSASLVPVDALGVEDTTTLFTGSGMQQFKPYFTGAAVPPNGRVTTVQKCVRTGDIDSVGDFSHCTFFEMLGNFSFGDYFKAEVIPWTWEFLTQVVGLDPDRFEVTVFEDDDEAFAVWRDVIGLPESRIHRLEEDKNYWPASAISQGPNGPCGPCSEVYFRVAPLDQMTTDPSLTPTERFKIDDDAGRWLEVWNNVFTQFERSEDVDGKAILTPLPNKNNDTGAGFDRIVQVHQGKSSVFETDLFQPVLTKAAELAGVTYGGTMNPTDFALRVIAEHTRTMVFCIADGILPSNEGRGYVLRYIMRRAMRYGKAALNLGEPFLHTVAPLVIDQMGGFYTELQTRRDLILKTILGEEERFLKTLENGMSRLQDVVELAKSEGRTVITGHEAFTLYDTFGFPLDLTRDMALEAGLTVDEAGFVAEREEAQRRSRDASAPKAVWAEGDGILSQLQKTSKPTEFVGYTQTQAFANVVGIVSNGSLVESARAGDETEIVLDRSSFYAESGGQVGDSGRITASKSGTTCALVIEVRDTQKQGGYWLHKVKVLEGEVTVGQQVFATVDAERRQHIRRNHTCTHLLQAALREILGSHVYQKGSLVAPDLLRFDFTHTQPMTHDELWRVEERVNEMILANRKVTIYEDLPIEEAKQRGAMALFGEKYGDKVRLVEVVGESLELCGGTHLQTTGEASLFKITSESGIGAGIRRIEAQTGRGAITFVNDTEKRLEQVASMLKSNPRDVLVATEKLLKERSELHKQIEKLRSGSAATLELSVDVIGGISVVIAEIPGADVETLSSIADREAEKLKSAVIVLAGVADGKIVFVAKVTRDLTTKGLHAGNLVREVAKVAGGGGGGRPDFAQAGGRDAAQVGAALAKARELITAQLGQ